MESNPLHPKRKNSCCCILCGILLGSIMNHTALHFTSVNTIRISASSIWSRGTIRHFPLGGSAKAFHFVRIPKALGASKAKPSARKLSGLGKLPDASMPAHPFHGLACTVAFRLENPLMLESRKENAAKPKQGEKGEFRLKMSFHDLQDVRSIVTFEMMKAKAKNDENDEETDGISHETWIEIFSEARKALFLNRKVKRQKLEVPLTTQDTWAEPTLTEKVEEKGTRDRIAKKAWLMRQYLKSAYALDDSRKAKATYHSHLHFLRMHILPAVKGEGTQGNLPSGFRMRKKRFLEYASKGQSVGMIESEEFTLPEFAPMVQAMEAPKVGKPKPMETMEFTEEKPIPAKALQILEAPRITPAWGGSQAFLARVQSAVETYCKE